MRFSTSPSLEGRKRRSADLAVFYNCSPATAAASLLLFDTLGLAYPIYFHARWGQTLGKMVAKIKVTQLDGQPITARHALRRSLVDVLLLLAVTPPMVYVLATWTGPDWSSLGLADQVRFLNERNPLYFTTDVVAQIWYWSEVVVLLFSRKRRALHDFIAGTVVIRTGQARPKTVPSSAVSRRRDRKPADTFRSAKRRRA